MADLQGLERSWLTGGLCRADEDALAFFRRVDEALVKEAVADLARMDEATARPEDYVDLGQERQFVVAIGQGECAS